MRSPLIQMLGTMVKLDAHDTRKIIDMAAAHLRDLEAGQSTAHRRGFKCSICGLLHQASPAPHKICDMREGADLQRGLEAVAVRERERLYGPDDEGQCPACEDEGHVGYTDDF